MTEQPWDPAVGAPWSHGDKNVTFIGEYFGFDATGTCFIPLWTDTRTGMQELFTCRVAVEKRYELVGGELGGKLIGGIARDGGGWVMPPNGPPIPVPPWDPMLDLLSVIGIYEMANDIKDASLRTKLKTAAVETVGEIAKRNLPRKRV